MSVFVENESIAAIIMAPKDVCALIFRTGEYVTYMADVVKIKTVRRRDYVRITWWSAITQVLKHRESFSIHIKLETIAWDSVSL